MVNRIPNPAAEEVEDCGQRLIDLSDRLSYDGFSDELEDIEIRLEMLIERMEALRTQIQSLQKPKLKGSAVKFHDQTTVHADP